MQRLQQVLQGFARKLLPNFNPGFDIPVVWGMYVLSQIIISKASSVVAAVAVLSIVFGVLEHAVTLRGALAGYT